MRYRFNNAVESVNSVCRFGSMEMFDFFVSNKKIKFSQKKLYYPRQIDIHDKHLVRTQPTMIHNKFDIIQRDVHQHRLNQTIHERSHLRSTSI